MTTDNEAAAVEAAEYDKFAAMVNAFIAEGESVQRSVELARAAIAAHTAASAGEAKGDRLAIRMLVAAGFVTEAKANEALRIANGFEQGPLAPPPAAVPADALERLVEEMRRESTDDHPMQHRGIPTVHADIRRWADELAALIPKGDARGQG